MAIGLVNAGNAQVVGTPLAADPGVIIVSGTPAPAKPVTLTASPNPIALAQGATLGKTTLRWNAPAHDHLVIRANEKQLAGDLPSSGSYDTGSLVTDGMVLALIDPVIGQTLASITVTVIPAPPPGPVTFTANPNPITLPAGVTSGKTTLTWNGPGYTHLVIRVNGGNLTGTVGSSGSADTGNWVTDGMVFSLVDLDSSKTLATVTVKVITTSPPPPPPSLTITNSRTAGALARDPLGNPDFCTPPAGQSVFRTVDKEVWIWLTTANAHVGDVLAVNWIHPSGRVEAPTPATLNYSGAGCHAWFFTIQGASPALEPGNWQVRVLTNGTTAVTLPFTILSTLSVTNKTTTAGLVGTGIGLDYCAVPVTKTAFRITDPSVWLWYTIDNARPGDVLAVNWVHPSGRVDAFPNQVATVNYSGSGCYGWYINIRGDVAAGEPGNWQVRLVVNGATAISLPFTISP
jgi:hypothetical protein